MAYWLFKSEPFKWSWDMQKKKGKAGEQWDGVRNYQARNNMRAMKLGAADYLTKPVDPARLLESVRARLYTLPEDWLVYPGHGPATTLEAERRSNPFVRG